MVKCHKHEAIKSSLLLLAPTVGNIPLVVTIDFTKTDTESYGMFKKHIVRLLGIIHPIQFPVKNSGRLVPNNKK